MQFNVFYTQSTLKEENHGYQEKWIFDIQDPRHLLS